MERNQKLLLSKIQKTGLRFLFCALFQTGIQMDVNVDGHGEEGIAEYSDAIVSFNRLQGAIYSVGWRLNCSKRFFSVVFSTGGAFSPFLSDF